MSLSEYHIQDRSLIQMVDGPAPISTGLYVKRDQCDNLELVEVYFEGRDLWVSFGSYAKPLHEVSGEKWMKMEEMMPFTRLLRGACHELNGEEGFVEGGIVYLADGSCVPFWCEADMSSFRIDERGSTSDQIRAARVYLQKNLSGNE